MALSILAVVASTSSACASDSESDGAGSDGTSSTVVVDGRFEQVGFIPADEPAAMAQTPDGSLLIGELSTGVVVEVTADELSSPEPNTNRIATLEVATEGQQGLVGLAALDDGTILAGLTRPGPGEPRQVVVRVVPDAQGAGEPETVWEGPVAADDAIGGRLDVLPDGRVVIGLGDFLRGRADSFDADEPFSKLLSIDPLGPADQEPVVISEGWNNPFAFTVGPDGAIWIADNAPGATPERIGRGDGEGPLVDLPAERAPSGVAVIGPDELALCGYISGTLELVQLADGVPTEPSTVLAEPCRLGVLALDGGGLAVAVEDGVRILAPT